jgi:hypothetical protein
VVAWWFWQVREKALFDREGIGKTLLQWGLAALVFLALNRWLASRSQAVGLRRIDVRTMEGTTAE